MITNNIPKVLLYENSKDKYINFLQEHEEEHDKTEETEEEETVEEEESNADDYDQIFITRDDTDSVVFSIIEKFLTRSELGRKKYGTDLDRQDLSVIDWIRHAQEEHMDAILYLEKLKQELKLLNSRLIDYEIDKNKKSKDNTFLYISILIILFYNLFITYHYNHIISNNETNF